MADEIDYRALYERAERGRQEAERALTKAEKQLAKTSFSEFLDICHHNIFMKLNVERNKLLSTTGRMTRVEGKQYPRYLKPWVDFGARHEESFAVLEQAFHQQALFPSPAGLDYLADKLSDRRLASEDDLRNFECLAVEGCALDVLPRFLDLVGRGATRIPRADAPSVVSFNNYPFGVVATESDEEEPEGQDESASSSRSPSRGRARTRSSRGRGSRKPLSIKQDRPAYIGALGVAKRDMDAAIAQAAAEADERERSGPPRKRPSPERTKVHPDQWCFRHSADGTMRPLFVIEYKAAHKIDEDLLRSTLAPDTAASFMEDVIKSFKSTANPTEKVVAKRDIAMVLTQTFHYMVDYGLQYSYATTGHALIFLYLDPEQPSTLYYHMEEPARTVKSTARNDLKHSAVALVLAFVLMAMQGRYMTHRWKKTVHKEQPTWPTPYEDTTDAPKVASVAETMIALAPGTGGGGCGDPQKQGGNRRRDQDDDDDDGDDGGPGPTARSGGTTRASTTAAGAPTAGAVQPPPDKRISGTAATHGSRQAASTWSLPVDAPLSPALQYCTQACLGGLKMGGNKDPRCPNVHLHRRRATANPLVYEGDNDNDDDDGPHPISVEQLREMLVQQLADDMDHDCQSLERFGMYGRIGALFKLALSAYGYCFVGKGVQRAHRKRLEKEAAAYGFLEACQGRLVPVNLGVIQLADEYWTECGAHISHMMLMSFAGDSLWHHGRKTGDTMCYRDEMLRTLRELQPYGVMHCDENDTNMAWNEELQRVMAIDFDCALVQQQQRRQQQLEDEKPPAGGLETHRKRYREYGDTKHAKRAKIDEF
ncbi:phosphotransferase-like protein [Niveomyces insectorum RCEF 264]|uniref:Phosphotransferase-like protein n=1 Tax=Niveomyces insectorum RCEF 264 TaxID=1081102 RepID=A0A167S4M8_9HYPO|nr:phosphotransferase-like protein [Niveomyces insectorum RCEF 264]